MKTLMGRVSVIIAGRTETYFKRTVESVLESASGDVEVVAVVDGDEAEPRIESTDPRVKIIRLEKSIGQRAGYNLGVRESTGEYVMKIDAHCLLSPGFDTGLKAVIQKHGTKVTVMPEMKRLDVENWKPKRGGETLFMFPGLDLYCHYWPQYKSRPVASEEYPETMTGQGSCWFCTREWNDHIGLLDEAVGSWGNVGIEISLRTYLCGGSQRVHPGVWQAHYFRKDDGGFPYPMNGRQVARAHKYTWDNYYFKDNAFKNQTLPFKSYVERFAPVPGWEAYLSDCFESNRQIVYYTDSKLESDLAPKVRKRIKSACGPIPITCVSQQACNFGEKNVVLGEQPRKYKSVYEAVAAGLKSIPDNSIVYLCEHDVFYHPSHFAFLPPEHGVLYFNTNRNYYHLNCDTFLDAQGSHALSQCVAFKEDILKHVGERLAVAEDDIVEPWDVWEKRSVLKCKTFNSDRPNVDILHGANLTLKGSHKKDYISGKTKGIKNLPGWGGTAHFGGTTGYKKNTVEEIKDSIPAIDAAAILSKLNNGQASPVRIPKWTREKNLAPLLAKLGYTRGAEIGVRRGEFSEVLCKSIPNLHLTCVDSWTSYFENDNPKIQAPKAEEWYNDAVNRLSKYKCEFLKAYSSDAAQLIKDESLDFVYIDGNHTFDYVMEDLINWGRKVRKGGIIAGHDYFRFRNAGVVPAVDVYTQQHAIHEWFITDEKEASFFFVKTQGAK